MCTHVFQSSSYSTWGGCVCDWLSGKCLGPGAKVGLVQSENVTGGGQPAPKSSCQVSVSSAQVNTLENSKRQVAEGVSSVATGSPLSQTAARWGGRGSCARPGAQAWGAWLKGTWAALATLSIWAGRTDFTLWFLTNFYFFLTSVF